MSEIEPGVAHEEHDEQNDAVIGQAFLGSIAVLALAGTLVVGVMWLKHRPDRIEITSPPTAPTYTVRDKTVDLPNIPFKDVTTESGIDFVHVSGAAGEKLLPESMGGGVAVIDFDSDGDLDIVFVNGKRWPWEIVKDETPQEPATMSAWRNDGNWEFTNVTQEVGLDLSFYGMGAAVGDYDADGDSDLYLTAVGSNHLLRNDGGRFVDVTTQSSTDKAASVAGGSDTWSISAGFLDYDNDGDLD
ncbi:MAG: VCBS repeat-containing protein, partial [Planctomycetota bacterium]|nr:VCBS repeat-containing protein [Planctomycetota bacterium]